MSDESRSSPIPATLTVLLLVGGVAYFLMNYNISGLDSIKIEAKNESEATWDWDDQDDDLGSTILVGTTSDYLPSSASFSSSSVLPNEGASPFDSLGVLSPTSLASADENRVITRRVKRVKNLRIGSWALDGFGPSKLAAEEARQNIVRVAHQFDILALQQIRCFERDVVPRLVDAINEGDRKFEFVLGTTTGPRGQPEQLAFLFDTETVQVDRTQVYSVADPSNQMTYDPLVAWFRAVGPRRENAWTFSAVNVHINLQRASAEVALLPDIFSAVRLDGRGEDDVVMLGLFQADDRYMIPSIMGDGVVASILSTSTDIFGRHQTCNVLLHTERTSEYLGRGGTIDFLRRYNLSATEAETVSSHLPVYADFTAFEGGKI